MLSELHLTVAAGPDRPDLELESEWARWCRERGLKPLAIRLVSERGLDYQHQLMCAAVSDAQDPEAWAMGLLAGAVSAGFPVLRRKLEMPLDKWTEGVKYWECHVKAVLAPERVDDVLESAAGLGWAASQNLRFQHDLGLEKWYFTLRVMPKRGGFQERLVAAREFADRFSDLRRLQELGLDTVRIESEAVLQDSNPALDKGWA